MIPLDVHGRPIFPIALGDLTIYSLGEVVSDRIAYHTEDLIFPVGYCSTRVYANLRDPRTKSLYTCKILDGGPKPRYNIKEIFFKKLFLRETEYNYINIYNFIDLK